MSQYTLELSSQVSGPLLSTSPSGPLLCFFFFFSFSLLSLSLGLSALIFLLRLFIHFRTLIPSSSREVGRIREARYLPCLPTFVHAVFFFFRFSITLRYIRGTRVIASLGGGIPLITGGSRGESSLVGDHMFVDHACEPGDNAGPDAFFCCLISTCPMTWFVPSFNLSFFICWNSGARSFREGKFRSSKASSMFNMKMHLTETRTHQCQRNELAFYFCFLSHWKNTVALNISKDEQVVNRSVPKFLLSPPQNTDMNSFRETQETRVGNGCNWKI